MSRQRTSTATSKRRIVPIPSPQPHPTGVMDLDIEIREFTGISDRANRLLRHEEGFDVDFKRSLSGLDSEDLVSFANSIRGGTELIGVDETKNGSGRQVAVIVGCPVGDSEKLKILSKSNQCVPPVPVSVFIENSAEKPFYRIEISSAPHKPYCTSGGTYKTRGDGRKETLYPPQLLALFLKTEGGEFLQRFRQATGSLETAVRETKEKITDELKEFRESVWSMESNIKRSLDEIGASASNAESNAEQAHGLSDEAMHLMDQIHAMVEDLAVGDPALDSIADKLDALLEKFDIEDPTIMRDRRSVKAMARVLAKRSREKGVPDDRSWIASTLQKIFSRIDRKQVARWAKEGLEESGPEEPTNLSPRYAALYQMVVENEVQKRQTKLGKSKGAISKGRPKRLAVDRRH
jgi:ATP-dependent DNA helicase RecG